MFGLCGFILALEKFTGDTNLKYLFLILVSKKDLELENEPKDNFVKVATFVAYHIEYFYPVYNSIIFWRSNLQKVFLLI